MDLKALEQAVVKPSARRSERELLGDVGLFGVHMALVGLGVEVLSKRPGEVGKDLMRLGVLLGATGYGVRWVL